MKMMHGACFLACSNMSRTRLAPTPTNISTKSEPEIEKNGTFASPAMALASRVLPVPGRTDHQHAARNLAAQLLELAGIAQELDQLADFLLGLVAASHVAEVDLDLILALQLGARTTEAHRTATAGASLHLAHEPDEHADDQNDRQPVEQQAKQREAVVGRILAHFHALVLHLLDHRLVDQPSIGATVRNELPSFSLPLMVAG